MLPLFEHSYSTSKDTLIDVELYAAQNDIKIALETCNDDYPFNIVYDTGNRSQEGINLAKDIARLGKRIAHVHIKDKDWQGNNVLLGTGEVNFKEVCKAFVDIGYDGTMTFETVRGKDPIARPNTISISSSFFWQMHNETNQICRQGVALYPTHDGGLRL